MSNTRSTLLLLTLSAGLFAGACATEDSAIGSDFRAMENPEQWDILGPTTVNSSETCDEYWSKTCEGLSATECILVQDRLTCSPSEEGLLIEDSFWFDPTSPTWGAVDAHGKFSQNQANDPYTACEGLEDYEGCLRLAEVADVVSGLAPEIMQHSPDGGAGSLVQTEHGFKISPEVDPKANDLLLGVGHAFDWGVPSLSAFDYNGTCCVIEDDIIIWFRPNGTISLSTGATVISQNQALAVEGDCKTTTFIEEDKGKIKFE